MTDWPNRKPRVGAPAIMACGNLVLSLFLAVFFFWWPLGAVVRGLGMLRDPATIPEFAFEWHRTLSPRIEEWAQRRVASGRASTLAISQVAAPEWPVFGSVFYLWATEALHDYRDGAGIRVGDELPISYARGAIEASAALIVDPGHAKWGHRSLGRGLPQSRKRVLSAPDHRGTSQVISVSPALPVTRVSYATRPTRLQPSWTRRPWGFWTTIRERATRLTFCRHTP